MAPRDELAEKLVDTPLNVPYDCPLCGETITVGETIYAYDLRNGDGLGDVVCQEHEPSYPTRRAVRGVTRAWGRRMIVGEAWALDTSDPENLTGEKHVSEKLD